MILDRCFHLLTRLPTTYTNLLHRHEIHSKWVLNCRHAAWELGELILAFIIFFFPLTNCVTHLSVRGSNLIKLTCWFFFFEFPSSLTPQELDRIPKSYQQSVICASCWFSLLFFPPDDLNLRPLAISRSVSISQSVFFYESSSQNNVNYVYKCWYSEYSLLFIDYSTSQNRKDAWKLMSAGNVLKYLWESVKVRKYPVFRICHKNGIFSTESSKSN